MYVLVMYTNYRCAFVERISLGSLRQSLKITVVTLTDPRVILRRLWCAY